MSGQYGPDAAGEGGSEVTGDNIGIREKVGGVAGWQWSAHGFDLIDSLPSTTAYI